MLSQWDDDSTLVVTVINPIGAHEQLLPGKASVTPLLTVRNRGCCADYTPGGRAAGARTQPPSGCSAPSPRAADRRPGRRWWPLCCPRSSPPRAAAAAPPHPPRRLPPPRRIAQLAHQSWPPPVRALHNSASCQPPAKTVGGGDSAGSTDEWSRDKLVLRLEIFLQRALQPLPLPRSPSPGKDIM